MNALEALRHHTGCEPTHGQIKQAHEWRGLNDPDTIASIPEQVRVMGLNFFAEHRLVPPLKILAEWVDLRAWKHAENGSWRKCRSSSIAKSMGISRPLPKEYVHPVVWLYVRGLDRLPDADGFGYWSERLLSVGLRQLERDFLGSISDEDRARLDRR